MSKGESTARIYLKSGQTVDIRLAGEMKVEWNKTTGEIQKWSLDETIGVTAAAIPPQSIVAIVSFVAETPGLPAEVGS